MLSDPSPRPPPCYDPTVAAHRDDAAAGGAVHVHDRATIRALLRDARRVTSDVTELLTPETRGRVHPVSAFVWATDRWTISGCPGRHAALRAVMAPWFTASQATDRQQAARRVAERILAANPEGPCDVHDDYVLPVVVAYLAGWLGVPEAEVRYAVADQVAAGEFFGDWPMLSTPEMDGHYRALFARTDLRGIAAQARELVGAGTLGEREAWAIVYSVSVSAVATAASATLAIGLALEHGLWAAMAQPEPARAAVEEAVRLGAPFPQASRFVREPLRLGDVELGPGDQVLMWLTAANRDLPAPAQSPPDRFDPARPDPGHLGWGSGYHLCAGVHHARAVAATAVTTLARLRPDLSHAGPWRRFVGIDDGYLAAPVTPFGPTGRVG